VFIASRLLSICPFPAFANNLAFKINGFNMNILFYSVFLVSLATGIFIVRQPRRVIDIQKKFYLLINWQIEPVSMDIELRNTRWMGLFLILFAVAALIYHFSFQT
jgi:hypothetical protein